MEDLVSFINSPRSNTAGILFVLWGVVNIVFALHFFGKRIKDPKYETTIAAWLGNML